MEAKVDDLFRWNTLVELQGRQIYVRTLSALDDGERTNEALRAARQERLRLLSKGSPAWKELTDALKALDRDKLLAVIRLYQTQQAEALAYREVNPTKDPPRPVEPTLEAAMDAADEWADEMVALEKRRREFVKSQITTYMDLQSSKTDEELLELTTDLEINAVSTGAYAREYEVQTIWRATYKDESFKRRFFQSPEQVRELGTQAYNVLLVRYRELDRFAADAETLKN